mmetsp:Transcript_12115/g.24690  ORF Transcript_12115/g.24690 Transcript_12115/m.24690 type:complete len:234 (-) Transcript_12115:244-945(-)
MRRPPRTTFKTYLANLAHSSMFTLILTGELALSRAIVSSSMSTVGRLRRLSKSYTALHSREEHWASPGRLPMARSSDNAHSPSETPVDHGGSHTDPPVRVYSQVGPPLGIHHVGLPARNPGASKVPFPLGDLPFLLHDGRIHARGGTDCRDPINGAILELLGKLCVLLNVVFVITVVKLQLMILHCKNLGGNLGDKVSVVAHHNDCSIKVPKRLLEHLLGWDVQMIGWLVEHK